MEKEPLRVLFLCTGYSVRSQIGEALLRHMSRGEDRGRKRRESASPEVQRLLGIA